MIFEDNSIRIDYDGSGEKIKAHQMNAKLVADSISAMNFIIDESYKEIRKIYHAELDAEVFIDGGFGEGSLWWLLRILGQGENVQGNLSFQSVFKKITQALNKVIEIMKKISPNKTEIVITQQEEGNYTIEVDGKSVVLDELEAAILSNKKIRASISDLVRPLLEEGIDTLNISPSHYENSAIKINKEERDSLLIERQYKTLLDEGTVTGKYYIETLSYNKKSRWKIIPKDEPRNGFNVSIIDEIFLASVAANREKFAKDDLLDLQLHWKKEKTSFSGKIKTTYTVTTVFDHISVDTSLQEELL
ncbi:hypothetical protein HQN60_06180 [Deefgea piscis]|uniref:Uncharacterized protein n=1 Tax=Deefgea piscis TaxID=2739061 RepID=A0A6M8SMI5_9NEIS|nr:hypothetical protein [Deefgea piscis]QKJ66323.1 hypothetical protein HQN60_06180 [Deefgea piscis]